MKFSIDQKRLLNALAAVAPIAGKGGAMPLLSHIKASAAEGKISIEANNLESAMRWEAGCTVEVPGEVCVPGKRMLDIIKVCPDEDLRINLNKESLRLEIQSSGPTFKIACMDSQDFPALPSSEGVAFANVDTFADALESVSFSASSQENRFALNCICLENIPDGTRLTATDGYRLSRYEIPYDVGVKADRNILLPKIAASALIKAWGADANIGVGDKCLFLRSDGMEASFRLVDEEYPDASKVIPGSCEVTVAVDKVRLMTCIERAALFNDDSHVGVTVRISENRISVSASHADFGEGSDSMAVDYDASAMQFIVNPHYVLDALRHLAGDMVNMEFAHAGVEGEPIVLRSAEANAPRYFTLVMPMRK